MCLIASLIYSSHYIWSHTHVHNTWNSLHSLRNLLTLNQWFLLSLIHNILLFLSVLLILIRKPLHWWSWLLNHLLLSYHLLILHYLVLVHLHHVIWVHLLILWIILIHWKNILPNHLSSILRNLILLLHLCRWHLLIWVHFYYWVLLMKE